jgi:AraC family transcriptional regulator, regulatory protein of adaptative response / methylated-DNA-[protein]-cysteine methyltransferase
VTLEAVTPGELKAQGAGVLIRYGFSDTPFGRALLAGTARGISRLAFCERERAQPALVAQLQADWPAAQLLRDDDEVQQLARRIWPAPQGAHPPDAAPGRINVAVSGTNFQLKVWRALLELGARGPTTYSAVARQAGLAGSERAVGNAVAMNPVAWLIPCHNVLRKDGTLGGYQWGEGRKRAMLAWSALDINPHPPESAPVKGGGRVVAHNALF